MVRSRERSWEGKHWLRLPGLTQSTVWIGEWSRVLSELTKFIKAANPSSLVNAQSQQQLPPASSKKPDAFNGWMELAWTREHAMDLWRHLIRALGHPLQAGWEVSGRELVVRSFVETAEQLLAADATLVLVELGPLLLDLASGLTNSEEVRSRCLTIAMVGHLFVRRWSEELPRSDSEGEASAKGLWLRFLLTLKDCLQSDSEPAMLTALAHAADPISLGLPGSPLLIPAQLHALERLSAMPEAWAVVMPSALRSLQALLIMPDLVAPSVSIGESLTFAQAKEKAWRLFKQLDPIKMDAASQSGYLAILSSHLAHTVKHEDGLELLFGLYGRLAELTEQGQTLLIDALLALNPLLAPAQQTRLMQATIEQLGMNPRLTLLAIALALNMPADWIQTSTGQALWSALLARPAEPLREWALEHLLALQNDWPLYAQSNPLGQQGLLFALGDHTLLQINSRATECQMTVRSAVLPQLTWSVEVGGMPERVRSLPADALRMPAQEMVSPWIDRTQIEYSREERKLPLASPSEAVLERVDVLAEVLAFLGEDELVGEDIQVDEGDAKGSKLLKPALLTEARLQPVVAMQRIAGELLDAEQRLVSSLKPEPVPQQIRSLQQSNSFQVARQFLTNLSLLQRQHGTSPLPLRVLPRRAAVWRDLRLLDQLPAKQTVRVACLFVGKGQREEQEIIMNDDGSLAYRSLLQSLAWKVPLPVALEQEEGGAEELKGGLSASQSKDGMGWYWESPLAEVFFHDGCSLSGDAVRRKRHLGNAPIQLVWSEHWQDYDPLTITGDWGQVVIMLYPVERWPAAVRVQIWTRPGVPSFGPLHHGCLVARSELASLLRPTLLAAHLALQSGAFMTPWEQRHRQLSQLVERWALSSWTMEQVLQYAMFANQPLPDELILEAEMSQIEEKGDTLQLAEMKAELEQIQNGSLEEKEEKVAEKKDLGEFVQQEHVSEEQQEKTKQD